jgi:hypothetical protein
MSMKQSTSTLKVSKMGKEKIKGFGAKSCMVSKFIYGT